jgi:hypothetical protein
LTREKSAILPGPASCSRCNDLRLRLRLRLRLHTGAFQEFSFLDVDPLWYIGIIIAGSTHILFLLFLKDTL